MKNFTIKLTLLISLFSTFAYSEIIAHRDNIKINHIDGSDAYEVYKNDEKKSTIIIQTYEDIQRFKKYTKALGLKLKYKEAKKIKAYLDSTLREATPEEHLEVAIYNMKQITQGTEESLQSSSCSETGGGPTISAVQTPEPPDRWFCALCEPAPAPSSDDGTVEDKNETITYFDIQAQNDSNLLESWVGNNVEHIVTFDTMNDNPLHGGASFFTDEKTADDLGRTFGASLDYEAGGEEGDIKLGLEKNLFTWRISHTLDNGEASRFDEDGRRFGEATEETSLTLFTRKKYKGFYLAGELELLEVSNDNKGLQSVQDYWHSSIGSAEYNYLSDGQTDYAAKVKGGVSHKMDTDIGNWRCRMVNDALIGTDLLSPTDVELSLRTQLDLNSASAGGREQDNPWIGVSVLANHDISADGIDTQYGARLYTSLKFHDTVIHPFYGINYYNEGLDRRYQREDGKTELIHSIGFTMKF